MLVAQVFTSVVCVQKVTHVLVWGKLQSQIPVWLVTIAPWVLSQPCHFLVLRVPSQMPLTWSVLMIVQFAPSATYELLTL